MCCALAGCGGTAYEYPFQNPKLSFEERAADLVSRLTPDEKVAQMENTAPAIERFGIPPYFWWNECLHGVAWSDYHTTVYPQAIGMAAGWDVNAIKQMADYTAEEGRAIYNLSEAKQDHKIFQGLTYWTPNVNIFRDPRWGRGQETYGEDPFLTTALGDYFVRGLQGGDAHYMKAAACAKHFAVHSGPESSRHTFNAEVGNYDLWDTYLPAFKHLTTESKVAGVMCAYNAFDGQPCCAADKLMIQILRNDWKYNGYVTTDCGALNDFYNNHRTHPDSPAAAIDAVYHGTDLECGTNVYKTLKKSLDEGRIAESQIDAALIRLFTVRMRLGLFDPKEKVKYAAIDSTVLEAQRHKDLSLKMARQSIVLLKNEHDVLPINKDNLKKIAVVGPNANDASTQLGNYNGQPSKAVTPLDGIKDALDRSGVEIYYSAAIPHVGSATASFDSIIGNVRDADLIVYVGGISPRIEGEEMPVNLEGFLGGDRTSIALPAIQTRFLKALAATGKPVVFVMMTGSAVAIPWEAEHIPAIVNAWYGGDNAGTAIADVLFGRYNPSGRLPVTFYASDADLPDFEDYKMENRTYKYFKGKALYPFGYGLSYTTFDYEWRAKPKANYRTDETIRCSVTVKNTGTRDGGEVAQAYIKYPSGRNLPLKELRCFQRLTVEKGKTAGFSISIPLAHLAKWNDATHGLDVPKGEYRLFAGGSSDDEKLSAAFTVQ
jgi:beta-glucosidase